MTAPLLFGRLHVAPVVVDDARDNIRESRRSSMLTDRNVNLVEEGIDVAVRIGRLDDSSLVARPLGEVARVVCASPSYLRRHGMPRRRTTLRDRECLRFDGPRAGPRVDRFGVTAATLRVPVGGRFACNVVEPAIDAARAGGGVVHGAVVIRSPTISRPGASCACCEAFEPPPLPVNALFLSPRLMAARVRGFLDLLSAADSAASRRSTGPRRLVRRRAGIGWRRINGLVTSFLSRIKCWAGPPMAVR